MNPNDNPTYQCPACNFVFSSDEYKPVSHGHDKKGAPEEGDVTQCTACGEILVFCNDARDLRQVIDEQEMNDIFRDAPDEWMGA